MNVQNYLDAKAAGVDIPITKVSPSAVWMKFPQWHPATGAKLDSRTEELTLQSIDDSLTTQKNALANVQKSIDALTALRADVATALGAPAAAPAP
jgi:hypothetical protein